MFRIALALLACAFSFSSVASKIIYVEQNHPDATDYGSGTETTPYRTLTSAIKSIAPGDTIIIGEGVYRESISLPKQNWPGNLQTVITAKNQDTVLIKGSDLITGWKKLDDGIYRKNNWTVNSQQVFVDGQALTQIGGTVFNGYPSDSRHKFHSYLKKSSIWPGRLDKTDGKLPENSFYYDQEKQVLLIRPNISDDLKNHDIEVSVRPHLVYGLHTHGIQIKNINFQHANTSDTSRAGAITLRGNNIVLENIIILEADSVGLNLSGNNNIVRNSAMNYCGQLGMKVRGKSALIENNETSYNNTRGFNKWWEAGGTKIVGEYGLHDSLINKHKAFFNHGDGMWLDWGNKNVEIKNSQSAYNEGFGIHYEASKGAYIHDNFVFGNEQRGIYLPHSSDSLISNNLVAFNRSEGIVVVDEHRTDPRGILDLTPRNNEIIGNIIAWNKPGNCSAIIPPLKLNNKINYNLYITKSPLLTFSIGWPKLPLRLKIKGLDDWRIESSQDKDSWHLVKTINTTMQKDIDKKNIDIDWSIIYKMKTNYKVKENILNTPWKGTAAIHSQPGPSNTQ